MHIKAKRHIFTAFHCKQAKKVSVQRKLEEVSQRRVKINLLLQIIYSCNVQNTSSDIIKMCCGGPIGLASVILKLQQFPTPPYHKWNIYLFIYLFIYIYRYCSNFTLWSNYETTAVAGFGCICYINVLKMGDNALNQWFPKWAVPPPGGGGITLWKGTKE
jgi:hypothetical protein